MPSIVCRFFDYILLVVFKSSFFRARQHFSFSTCNLYLYSQFFSFTRKHNSIFLLFHFCSFSSQLLRGLRTKNSAKIICYKPFFCNFSILISSFFHSSFFFFVQLKWVIVISRLFRSVNVPLRFSQSKVSFEAFLWCGKNGEVSI